MDRFRFGLAGLGGPLTEAKLYGVARPGLEPYARMFGALELSGTQHAQWTRDDSERILDRLPSHVQLIPTLDRTITQEGSLVGNEARLDQWLYAVMPLLRSGRCGPLYIPWQDAWTKDRQDDLEHLLSELWTRLPYDQRVAVEFRHGTWFRPDPVHMLEESGAGLVWSTMGGMVPYRVTSDFVYVRLTGVQNRRVPDEVAALAGRLDGRPDDHRPVTVISARHHDPYGLRVLARFAERVGRTVRYGDEAVGMPMDVPGQRALTAHA